MTRSERILGNGDTTTESYFRESGTSSAGETLRQFEGRFRGLNRDEYKIHHRPSCEPYHQTDWGGGVQKGYMIITVDGTTILTV